MSAVFCDALLFSPISGQIFPKMVLWVGSGGKMHKKADRKLDPLWSG